ncbi:MAG TPA: hypothetical protein DCM28_18035 [Phycisphaerales bacterium]|nr:hypothetical protein [Phycisphaerales bacterium]HCD33235.1 hypothetical protein [Phycisphaerales bacterium]|tara:strand:- start:60 stop:290 length:231 start_codon:yes stop_codon:yes gene_type:complete
MNEVNHPDPVVLVSLPSEPQAAILIAALEGEGIQAAMWGELTSGFRADAPGYVKVLVKPQDLEAAQAVLAEHENVP